MNAKTDDLRFEFGKNWHNFVKRNFTEERLQVTQKHLLDFIGRPSLEGLDFLDIGCGSGLHSFGAFRSGARRIHGLDYDPNSVAASKFLREKAGSPANWTVERGDVLDEASIAKLGKWNFVYSWGVLHHTGDVWRAVRNAQSAVADGGLFYIALYAADVQPRVQFWLDKKQEYNRASPLKKKQMVAWYVWNEGMHRKIGNLPAVAKQIVDYRLQRGMNYFADVRDWLGGWPMEFVFDQEVVDLLEQQHGFRLINVATGQACSEYLFERTGTPPHRTIVTEMVARKKAVENGAPA